MRDKSLDNQKGREFIEKYCKDKNENVIVSRTGYDSDAIYSCLFSHSCSKTECPNYDKISNSSENK